MKRNLLFLVTFFFSGLYAALPSENDFQKVLSAKSLKMLRDTGFGHWDLRDAIRCSSSNEHYQWLVDYHRIQEQQSIPEWRRGPLPDLPSLQERNDKEKALVLAVLSSLKVKTKAKADQEEKNWEENEATRKRDTKCWRITAAILSIGAIIAGVVPCAHK